MSIAVMTQVWKSAPYSEGTLLALLALADWSDDEGKCWPKIDQLAEKARLTRSGAQYCMRKLIADGALSVEQESGGPGQPRMYRIGAQYLNPFPKKGLSKDSKRGSVNSEKGLSNPLANKEEPSVTVNINQPSLILSPSEEEKPKSDPRFTPFQKLIFRFHEWRFKNPPLWDGAEANQLSRLLKAAPTLDEKTFALWLRNYGESRDISPGERPCMYLPKISKYSVTSLNQYGRDQNVVYDEGKISNYERTLAHIERLAADDDEETNHGTITLHNGSVPRRQLGT